MDKKLTSIIAVIAVVCLVSGAFALFADSDMSVAVVSDNIKNNDDNMTSGIESNNKSVKNVVMESAKAMALSYASVDDVNVVDEVEDSDDSNVATKAPIINGANNAHYAAGNLVSGGYIPVHGTPINNDYADQYWKCPTCGGYIPVGSVSKSLPKEGLCILGEKYEAYCKKEVNNSSFVSYGQALNDIENNHINSSEKFNLHEEDVNYYEDYYTMKVDYSESYPDGVPDALLPILQIGRNTGDRTKIFDYGGPELKDRYLHCVVCGLFRPASEVTMELPDYAICVMGDLGISSRIHYNNTVSYQEVVDYINYAKIDSAFHQKTYEWHDEDLHPEKYVYGTNSNLNNVDNGGNEQSTYANADIIVVDGNTGEMHIVPYNVG